VIALPPDARGFAHDLAARPDEWRRVVLALQNTVRALGTHDVPASRCECYDAVVPAHFAMPSHSNAIT
jgi:hypothetical protein